MSDHPTTPGDPAEDGVAPARSVPVRRGPADPVRALMQRHRALCERAVDPLEIAAGLEAHGVTDRTAARFRHRDVFSLAEELYARVPRAQAASAAPAPAAALAEHDSPGARGLLRAGVYLLPGVLAAAVVAVLALLDGAGPAARAAVAAAGSLVVALALRPCLRRGPLRVRRGTRFAAPVVCWVLGYALLGDVVLTRALGTGHATVSASSAALPAALAFAAAPAAWCARWFAVRAHRGLAASRHLDEFASGSRPLVPLTVTLFALALGVLLAAAEALRVLVLPRGPDAYGWSEAVGPAAVAALGVLLFVARLLAVHGRPRAVLIGVGAAFAVEASALASALVSRLPGCEPVAVPVRAAVAAYGPSVVPLAACASAALLLLVPATVLLARASAHSGRPAAWGHTEPRPADRAEPSRDSRRTTS